MAPKSTSGSRSTSKAGSRRKVVSSLTLEELAASWFRSLEARNRSPLTIKTHQQALEAFTRWLDGREDSHQVVEISRRQIEEWLIELRQAGYAPNTILARHTALSVFFGWCVAEEELEHSPMARVARPTVPVTPPTLLSRAELEALLKTCGGKSFRDRRDRAIFLLLIDTGMRLHEIAQLTLANVDLRAQTLAIVGKGRRHRAPHFEVVAGAALDAYLRARLRFVQEHPRYRDEQALWLGGKGPFGRSGIAQMVRVRAKAAGITGVHPHLFRHGFADMWLAAGGTEGDLARLAGWTPGSKMLYRYGAAQAEERAREAHKRLSPANRLTREREK